VPKKKLEDDEEQRRQLTAFLVAELQISSERGGCLS
jgi:hypothetical protein